MKNFQKTKTNSGAAMLIAVIFFIFISLAIISGLVMPSVREFKISNESINSKKSYFLSESGVEDAYYRILKNKPISNNETLSLDSNSATTTINTTGSNQRTIVSLGDVKNFQRKISMLLQQGAGVGFNYGIQSGVGGFSMDGGSQITGNVYSNGNIQASTGVKITGTAIAAGATSYIGDNVGSPWMGTVVVGSGGVGNAWAYNVRGGNIAGNLYCQIGDHNNKSCDTSKGIPPAVPLPFTDENINAWKAEGTAGGTITGSTNCPGGYSGGNCTINSAGATFGPGKITGNLVVNGGGTLTLTGTLYVVGTVTVSNGAHVVLPVNYDKYSATIISDSYILLGGGSYTGSGAAGSYLFVVSTSTCPVGAGCSGYNAINVTGGSGTIAVCAQSGTVSLTGGVSVKSVVGKTISVTGGSKVIYEDGLASPSFVGGSSGGWNVLGWGETE
jgi:hypothetical protein